MDTTVSDQECEAVITGIDLILQNILHFVKFKDLQSCAIVNRRWHNLARSELKKNRRCYLKINPAQPCRDLIKFDDFIQKSKCDVRIYNGLTLNFSWRHYNYCTKDVHVGKRILALASKLSLKYLNITLDEYTECYSMQLIKQLLRTHGNQIEALCVSSTYMTFENLPDFKSVNPQDNCWLPNLKFLEIGSQLAEGMLPHFIDEAPTLRIISGNIQQEDIPGILQKQKAHLITELVLDLISNEEYSEGLVELAKVAPKLRQFSLKTPTISGTRWDEIVPPLLQSSFESMTTLELAHLDLLKIHNTANVILPKLKKLTLHYNIKIDRHFGLFTLGKINFPHLFPKLSTCCITQSNQLLFLPSSEDLAWISNKFQQGGDVHICQSVVNIRIFNNPLDFQATSFCTGLVNLFPKVKLLDIKSCGDVTCYLRILLDAWQGLVSLGIHTKEYPTPLTDLDALFCGISSEERRHLQSVADTCQDDFLRDLNLVPSQRSLLHLHNLGILKITAGHNDACPADGSPNATYLSQIAGHLVFSRMPFLSIKLTRNLCKTQKNSPNCSLLFDDLRQFENVHISKDIYMAGVRLD